MSINNPHLTDINHGVEAASRLRRLLARLVDGLVWFAPLPLIFFPCFGGLLALGTLLAILIGQVWLLITRGQTIGKKYLDIYIMRNDGSIPNIGWLFIREFAIPMAVGFLRFMGHRDPSPVGQALQVVLAFFWVIDNAFILGPKRRCLHDYVAGTHVVRV